MTEKLRIQYRKVDALAPYARNSRAHSPEQVAQIAASIREFGFTNPVLIDEAGTIIAGHGRVLAARECALESIPCVTLAGLTDAQRRAYVIADNRIAESGQWDADILRGELEAIRADFDLGLVGFADFDFGQAPPAGTGAPGHAAPPVDPLAGYKEQYGVIVICKDAAHQEAIYNELKDAGHECRVVVT